MNYSKVLKMFCALLLTVLLIPACGGDDDGGGGGGGEDCNWVTEIDPEFQALFNARTAYNNDASSANCQAFQDALNEYIDKAEDLEACATDAGQFQDYKIELDSAISEVTLLNCP